MKRVLFLALALLGAGCTTIWSADHEVSDTGCTQSEWHQDQGGGEFNSGNADTMPVEMGGFAHGGHCGLRMLATAPPEAGTRMFRWKETEEHDQVQLGAWLNFQGTTCPPWWNVMQIKHSNASLNDPVFTLNVGCRPGTTTMYFYLVSHLPNPDIVTEQTVANLTPGTWTHVEFLLDESSGSDGALQVKQNGQTIITRQNVQTKCSTCRNEWSVNNYSADLGGTKDIFLDDAHIEIP